MRPMAEIDEEGEEEESSKPLSLLEGDSELRLSLLTDSEFRPHHEPFTYETARQSSVKQVTQSPEASWPLFLYKTYRQIVPLTQRIHGQKGFEPVAGVTIVSAIAVLTGVLTLRGESHIQTVLASTLMIGVPTILFTHKIFSFNELWLSHKFELDDKRVSPLSFQLATALFTFPGPLVSTLIATVVAYAILGWSSSTLVVQFLFVGVYLMLFLQFGRVLCVALHGNFGTTMKVYTTTLLINAVFSSLLVPSTMFPDGFDIFFYLSMTFWAFSGAVLNIFHDNSYNPNRSCDNLLSCVASDGNVAGRVLGFSPLSNSYRALCVLTFAFACLVVLETVLLYLRCTGLVYPRACQGRSADDDEMSSSGTRVTGTLNDSGEATVTQPPASSLHSKHIVDSSKPSMPKPHDDGSDAFSGYSKEVTV